MDLTALAKNQKAKINALECDTVTKKRLRSFGLDVGCEIQVKQQSIGNSNIEIVCEQGLIALRNNEAKAIKCEMIV